MIGIMKGNGVIQKRKVFLAYMLVFSLFFLAGCGGQSGSGETAAAGAESRADAEAADTESRTDTAEAADARRQADTENAGAQAGKAVENSAQAAVQNAVEGARREESEADGGAAAKKLSILGDSISTFDGWITEGYACYFPMSGEVPDVEQTWWKMVLKDTKMELCVNGSSSGSTCAGDSSSTDNFQYGCSDCRTGNLIGSNASFPDVIIVYMGTNDLLKSVPLGDNDGTRAVEEGIIENFSDAYCMILDKLIAYYPNAEIFCCNLPPVGDWGPESGPAFVTFVNGLELTSEDYGRQIEVIAAAKGCKIIDLQNCGITMENMEEYVTDGVHMNQEGMKLVRDAVEAALIN